ncbi:MAG: tRNA (adenosine(37)-N6)-threonylcarbamoyltransferase complex transferase subunit TsaD [Lachnospiraceae bacterium]|jgi:N6-L-threonylcarbamoyladenine synthase|nr:tRNA (adenosine(37)-N6)-threonylcarbamoyltransferase complex transferase subunit TsaD [Lachnospiraceae bacterium]
MKDERILAVETSCDETAAAVVEGGRKVLSNVISSQIATHALYGGVVPEIASRKHMEIIDQVVGQALGDAGIKLQEVDAIAVTYGPGLVGALLVGVAHGKAMAYALRKPLIGVNHIEGHVCANFITHEGLTPPFLCLVVSGGHTHLAAVPDYGVYEIIGETVDDAAGEAFDKVARALGLPYPGGPQIDRLAKDGNPLAFPFPVAKLPDAPYNFSFSGLKSAVLNHLNQERMRTAAHAARSGGGAAESRGAVRPGGGGVAAAPPGGDADVSGMDPGVVDASAASGQDADPARDGAFTADVAASFQHAVIEALVSKTMAAAQSHGFRKVALAGGVAANSALRARMREACATQGKTTLYYPDKVYCTDNAAMIGSAAYYALKRGERSGWDLNAVPGLRLGER